MIRDATKRLYPWVPAMVQDGLLSAYFVAKARRLHGAAFRRRLAALTESEHFDAAGLAGGQALALAAMLEAAAHAPYYRRLFAERGLDPRALRTPADLALLPLLEKESVRRAGDQFVDARLDRRLLLSARTSGTTGTPLQIYFTPEFEAAEEAFLARQWLWANCPLAARRVKLREDVVVVGEHPRRPYRWNLALRELRTSSFHLSPDTVAAYVAAIRRFRPLALVGWPSTAGTLATLMHEQGLECRIPFVFTSSENLSRSRRELLARAFGAQVFDHYGLTEGVVAIQQCERGSYHIIPEYGIVELLPVAGDHSGELREIVATGLLNRAMPLLRYRTGDHVRVKAGARCDCARAFPVVEEIVGRDCDLLMAASGARVPAADIALANLEGVRESQIVQEEDGRISVQLVPGVDYLEAMSERVRREVRFLVGELPIEVKLTSAIPREASGKFRSVISRCRPRPGRSPS